MPSYGSGKRALLIQAVPLAPASPVSMHRVATTPWSDDPRDGQDPSSDAAKRDRRSMPRIRSNVVIRCILHHVRNLSLRDPTVGVIDEQMLAVVLRPKSRGAFGFPRVLSIHLWVYTRGWDVWAAGVGNAAPGERDRATYAGRRGGRPAAPRSVTHLGYPGDGASMPPAQAGPSA
jgi:hypothetical protein